MVLLKLVVTPLLKEGSKYFASPLFFYDDFW
jgi:hypothetical protein